uniref:Ig-like domain-containing protein n=1 Tax=Arion vulgaris TaxID=1028688 RepID=A0A0B6ZSL5_9EUPU
MSVLTACLFTSLLITVAMANLQDWSELIYLDKPHTLSCNLTNENRSVSTSDTLIWTKLGSEVALKSDEYYQLLNDSGISNIFLKIRIVTEEMSGIYFCTVTDMNYEYVGRMVKGVNIAGFLTDDKFDEYEQMS